MPPSTSSVPSTSPPPHPLFAFVYPFLLLLFFGAFSSFVLLLDASWYWLVLTLFDHSWPVAFFFLHFFLTDVLFQVKMQLLSQMMPIWWGLTWKYVCLCNGQCFTDGHFMENLQCNCWLFLTWRKQDISDCAHAIITSSQLYTLIAVFVTMTKFWHHSSFG